LQLGYLIDFEVERDGVYLPRMRALSHFSFPWIFEAQRLLVWQRLMQRLEVHLRDTETIDAFYFESLLDTARKWHRQNPKRLAVEWYVKMLDFEGRLHRNDRCYICENRLDEEVAVMTGFKLAHPSCIFAPPVMKSKIKTLFYNKKTTWLSDEDVALLFKRMDEAF
jgi:hypothetical protein